MKLHIEKSDPLIDFLQKYSQKTVRFFPHSGNMGDGLITYATLKLFEYFGINHTIHDQKARFDGELIFIGGGGNMVEGHYEDVARLIWEHRENNKIVLLPHTIVGYEDIIKETYNNLTIFCREAKTYSHCLNAGGNPDALHLCHDAALYLSDDHFSQRSVVGTGRLNAMRTDAESLGTKHEANNYDISLAWNGDIWTRPEFVEAATNSMAEFVSQFAEVRTDRLHVAIMSALIGRSVSMYPNNYFKNRSVFDHSLSERFKNINFVEEIPTNIAVVGAKPNSEADVKSLKMKLTRERDIHSSTRRKLTIELQKLRTQNEALKSSAVQSVSVSAAITASPPGEETLRAEIRQLREQLQALYASKSWRYTKPFRKIRSFF